MLGRKKKAAPRDLTGWTFNVVNYPPGSKSYQAEIRNPEGIQIITMLGYAPVSTVFIKAKTPEIALDKAKQVAYNIIAEDELRQTNSRSAKF